MQKHIAESVVVVTGASSGIGRATALKIAGLGGTVVVAARQREALEEVARECEGLGGRALAVKTDVTNEEQVRHLARRAVETFGRIDAWVNDAAVTMLSRFEEAPSDAFRRVVETNFFGAVHGARAVLPQFRKQGYGVLINIASVLAKMGSPYASAYVASKFAVVGFSESLRMELRDAPDIHVCTILPATIDTPLFQHAANFTGRAVQAPPPVYPPEDVAEAIVDAICRPRREITVGRVRSMAAFRTLVPALAERFIAKKMDKQHFQDRPSSASPGNLFESMPQFNAIYGGWQPASANGRKPAWATGALVLAAGAAGVAWYFRRQRHRGEREEMFRPKRAA